MCSTLLHTDYVYFAGGASYHAISLLSANFNMFVNPSAWLQKQAKVALMWVERVVEATRRLVTIKKVSGWRAGSAQASRGGIAESLESREGLPGGQQAAPPLRVPGSQR